MAATVRVCGVPEHFNLPWLMALEEGAFYDRGVELEWTDVPEGTGKMCDLLRQGETDLAVILTEGLIKAISEGLPAGIVQGYIATPLLWGIHVAAQGPFRSPEELEGRIAAISRYGSGSHLMAYVNARNRNWATAALRFEVVGTLEGAIDALRSGSADYFMWERFTTQPIIDQGIFRRLDVCPTPWPCFVIACNHSFFQKHPRLVRHILEVINSFTAEFREIPSIDRTLANRYGQKLDDVRAWLEATRWSQRQLSKKDVDLVIDNLSELNLLAKNIQVGQVLLP